MDLRGTYYNTKTQVTALESMLRKLPDLSTPVRQPSEQRKPGRARQLNDEQVDEAVRLYEGRLVAGADR